MYAHAQRSPRHPRPPVSSMDPRVQPLAAILRLNTRLLLNCLDGLSDEMARVRHASGVNSAPFIAAHGTASRFFLLQTLGEALENPLSRFLTRRRRSMRLPTG